VWQILLVGVGIVLLVLGPGFYGCTTRTECTATPCILQWVHCANTVLAPNVQAALLTVGLGSLIAWWYQRRNKIMEFQFQTLKEAMSTFRDLSNVAWAHFRLRRNILVESNEGLEHAALERMRTTLDHHASDLHLAITAAHAIIPINHLLFSKPTRDHWGMLVTRFRQVTSDDLWAVEAHLFDIPEHRFAFVRGAAKEIGLPFREPADTTEDERQRKRAELQEWLQRAQSRPGPEPGGQSSSQPAGEGR